MMANKKVYKLNFYPLHETLKEINISTITQLNTVFSYVKKWGNLRCVIESLPDDHNNVVNFFKDVNKLNSTTFQMKKFNELWEKYNMSEITDYQLLYDKPIIDDI
jgi:hypothetical protein